VHPSPSSSR
jgi:hypothetical protein